VDGLQGLRGYMKDRRTLRWLAVDAEADVVVVAIEERLDVMVQEEPQRAGVASFAPCRSVRQHERIRRTVQLAIPPCAAILPLHGPLTMPG
jgi:hypothetical protein